MRLYYGAYGHHPSGKLYVYWGSDNLRTGQQVVAPVTDKRTGNTYNTMFTIVSGVNENNAQREVNRLNAGGISVKTIGGRDTLSLPGANDPVTGNRLFDSKAEWKRESDWRYENEKSRRLGQPPLERQEHAVFGLPGGSAPKVKNSLLRMKNPTTEPTKQRERLRAMKGKIG